MPVRLFLDAFYAAFKSGFVGLALLVWPTAHGRCATSVLSAVQSTRSTGAAGMTQDRTGDSSARNAALVTLTILRSAMEMGTESPILAYTISPQNDALSFDDVVAYLEQLPKPVECVGNRVGDWGNISCRQPNGEQIAERARRVAAGVSSANEMMREARAARPRADLIELRLGREQLLLSPNDYKQWRKEYACWVSGVGIGIRMDIPPAAYQPPEIGILIRVKLSPIVGQRHAD
jgi:hypothetical protein